MKPMMAKSYNADKHDPTGWWMFEKYDGVRAVYDSVTLKFLSRNGKEFIPPSSVLKRMPRKLPFMIDGELWIDRGLFNETSGKVRRKHVPDWTGIKFMAFDAIYHDENNYSFEERYMALKAEETRWKNNILELAPYKKCKNHDHLIEEMKKITAQKGEGIMLRDPESMYECRRSPKLLKVKEFHDCEVEVIDHQLGKGKYKGMCGALKCDFEGKEILVGSGLTDEQRLYPPKIGSKVTIAYFEVNNKTKVPRFPTFVGVRDYE